MSLTKPVQSPGQFQIAPQPAPKQRSIFTVMAGHEKLGLPISCVQTIFRISKVTPVPLGPEGVVGLVNLRGKIVTAVSLRKRLGLDDAQTHENAIAIGIEHRGESFALLVDEVGDVMNVSEAARIAAPANMAPSRFRITAAVFLLERDILSVLDMDAVLDFNGAIVAPHHSQREVTL